MANFPPKEPTPITPLETIKNKKLRVELEGILDRIALYKAQAKEAELALKGDKKTGEPGLNDLAASLLTGFGIKKTEFGGFTHTVTNGVNVSVSGEAVKSALMRRGMDTDEILLIMDEVTKKTPYTTITTTKAGDKEEEEGGVTGAKYRRK